MTSSPQFVPQKFCLFLGPCVFSRDCGIKLVILSIRIQYLYVCTSIFVYMVYLCHMLVSGLSLQIHDYGIAFHLSGLLGVLE